MDPLSSVADYIYYKQLQIVRSILSQSSTWLYALQNHAYKTLERLTSTEAEELLLGLGSALPVLIPSLGTLLLALLCLSSFRRSKITPLDRRPPNSQELRAVLVALLTFLTPTRSIWPETYLLITRRAVSDGKSTVRLPLRRFLDDVISGTVELRSPSNDLPAFISGSYRPQGMPITYDIDFPWRCALFLRVALLRLSSLLPPMRKLPLLTAPGLRSICLDNSKANPTTWKENRGTERTLSESPPAGCSPTVSQVQSVLLDAVPYSRLTAYIRTAQTSLAPGSSAVFGFSTLGSPVSRMSVSFVVASVPFLPRRHLNKSKLKSRRPGPEVPTPSTCGSLDLQMTPLLTSLDGIIKLLTSGPAPLITESIQNVSEQYASYLDTYVQDLTYAPVVRKRFVDRWGMEGWREERLMVGWEAALFRAGLLTRWAVLVHKTERVD